jgi:ABC-type branched-subunit amino acid transport system substrate-binding protein
MGGETVDAWLPLTEKEKVLAVVMTPSPIVFDPKNRYVFQASLIHTTAPALWGWFAKNHPEEKTVFSVYPDNRIGHGLDGYMRSFLPSFGLRVVDTIFYPPGTKNFGSIALKVKKSKADVFTTAGGGTVGDSLLYKSLFEIGFKGKRFSFVGAPIASMGEVVPIETLEGLVSGVDLMLMPDPKPPVKEYKEAYVSKHGKWDHPHTPYLNTWYCMIAGLEQAQSLDPDRIAGVISNGMKFDSLGYPALMVRSPHPANNRTVDLLLTNFVKRVEDGGVKIVGKIDLDEGMKYLKVTRGWK